VKTKIFLGSHSGKQHGTTPKFRPEEVIKDFWQWQSNVYVERPNAGGEKRHPTVKRPIDATLIDESSFGRLWQLTFEWRGSEVQYRPYGINRWVNASLMRQRTIRVVNVWNATKLPNGKREMFTLSVPRGVTTAREAVAWTFGMLHPQMYNPIKQT
jgi:hypothetical protein